MESGAVLGRQSQMQGIPGAKPQGMLINKPGGNAKMVRQYRRNRECLGTKSGEFR